ncbi:hypothetical protein MJO28_009971 [Puccinia striiformis f. sp. tritici]|uniref:Uncharacterized protein n=1 Tax=Puccinia striiformis f. sp. tritici TaxID=168172 RepID=A0ACC0E993_9BASI|nr:hypothetical protein Pst134EB_018131 [Puccinia striiformis f. sp. tritici]KAI7948063.1 hypothetical protein MJO28_009971 [Puccinia striiformis f. sp. tritici]
MYHRAKPSFAPIAAKCPSCLKSVYAAEQALGPGATPYHKSCLRCTQCQKVLDPFNILEHGYDPYCKICHSKSFGTKGVGYGNAVVGEYHNNSTIISPVQSPIINHHQQSEALQLGHRVVDEEEVALSSLHTEIKPRSTGSSENAALKTHEQPARKSGGPPTKNPLTPPPKPAKPRLLLPTRSSSTSPYTPRTLFPTITAKTGLDGPQKCPACSLTVYHAEQVLAIGKKWHKRCLRCTLCSKALDSNLNERTGKPYCIQCYHQHFGAGSHGFVLRAGFNK